jgi:hypothetical protein
MIVAVDTLWTGLSGLIIFLVIVWVCVRIIGGRR